MPRLLFSLAVQARDATDAARDEAATARRGAGVKHDDIIKEIKLLANGLAMHREAVERHTEDREQPLMDAHIAPLEASATNHEERIVPLEVARIDHEKRIKAVEKR